MEQPARLVGAAHSATEDEDIGGTLGYEHRAIDYRGNGASHRLRDDPRVAGARYRGTLDGGRVQETTCRRRRHEASGRGAALPAGEPHQGRDGAVLLRRSR